MRVGGWMNKEMLIKYLTESGYLKTKEIINAFKKVPRQDFVPSKFKKYAYIDEPLPTLKGQTISQPATIATMTEALKPKKDDKILEIGAGSGYQSAILSEIVGSDGKVITIEIVKELYKYAKEKLSKYKNVMIIYGDGSLGYEQEKPYDGIIVTASAPCVPEPLKEQLKIGGRLVIPVGVYAQKMLLLTKTKRGFEETDLGYFMFVPLTGKYGWSE